MRVSMAAGEFVLWLLIAFAVGVLLTLVLDRRGRR